MALIDAPVLVTERLELRVPVAADVAAMGAIVAHQQTGRFLGQNSTRANHFQRFCRNAGSWLLYGYGGFMVRLRGSEEIVGNVGVFHSWRGIGADFDDVPEAGWILRHDQVGRGVGFEAASAALDWFDAAHGPRRVVCMTAPGNEPSIRLAARLGFAPLREAELPDGEPVSLFERMPPGG